MTFFYLLTGGPPFSGRTIYEKLIAHKESPVPKLDELVDEVTPEVNDIFQLMLAKQPDDRYASMSDLVQAIDALQADQSSLQTAPRLANEMTVLIVEKSRFQASMISKLLNQLDIDDIHVTASGAEAMAS